MPRVTTIMRTAYCFAVLMALAASLLLTQAARPGHANGELIFKVNTTADFADMSAGNLHCDADAAVGDPCTLRAAIQEANATPELDAIHFNIPGSGVQTIAPTRQLPFITEPVVIAGYSQPVSSPNTATTGTNAVLHGANVSPTFNDFTNGVTVIGGGRRSGAL
jgi:CSLREA domain-containing protein